MSLETQQSAPAKRLDPAALTPVQRVMFDRWLFDFDLDNVAAGQLFKVHAVTIARWRKRFDDDTRVIPSRAKIAEVAAVSRGIVQPGDWYRPSVATYGPPAPGEVPTDPVTEGLAS